MATIATAHRAECFASTSLLVRKVIKGYRWEHRTAPHKKDATIIEIVHYLLSAILQDDSLKHIQDRSIISLGFAGAFRSS